ncbi:recombinase family protein [Micrococcus luteus]|nr:recombinase family protein [Micrococcus luteus]
MLGTRPHAAPTDLLEADLLGVGDTLVHGGEGAAIVEVRGVDRVTAGGDLFGERAHAVRETEGVVDILVAVRVDRVRRSGADFAGLHDRRQRRGWGLVLLSSNIDAADPAGRFTPSVLASAAQYEREPISRRTGEA